MARSMAAGGWVAWPQEDQHIWHMNKQWCWLVSLRCSLVQASPRLFNTRDVRRWKISQIVWAARKWRNFACLKMKWLLKRLVNVYPDSSYTHLGNGTGGSSRIAKNILSYLFKRRQFHMETSWSNVNEGFIPSPHIVHCNYKTYRHIMWIVSHSWWK